MFTGLLVMGILLGSLFLINRAVRGQVRSRLVGNLERSQHNLEQMQKDRLRELVANSIIASENSTLKAAIETFQAERGASSPVLEQLRRTVENEAAKLFSILSADLLVITSNTGQVLTLQGASRPPVPSDLSLSEQPSVLNSLSSNPIDFELAGSIWRFREKAYRVVSVPILLQDIVVGTLSSGFEINQILVRSFKDSTGSDVVFFAEGGIIASTLDTGQNQAFLSFLRSLPNPKDSTASRSEVILEGETFLAMQISTGGVSSGHFVVLNSIDQAMQDIMSGIKRAMILIGLLSIVLATLLGLTLSQSITRPLMKFVNFMDGITKTGDLKQRFKPETPSYEVDVLARTFESMARSLEESQAQTATYHEELRQKEFNEEKLRTLAARSRLDALISQINPHFFFNALNTVSVLIDENPVEARRLTVKLSNIFRRTLQVSEREMISLEEELNFIQDYLEIEKARFGDRLQIEHHVSAGNVEIPCFTLQPLVENAIKHGAAPKIGTTTISIEVRQTNSRLAIRVADDGVGMSRHALETLLQRGYGLKNLIDRLNILYPSDFSWKVLSESQRGTAVLLEIPCKPPVKFPA